MNYSDKMLVVFFLEDFFLASSFGFTIGVDLTAGISASSHLYVPSDC
tara:strand:+ start:214 stop:354 length:141 start_codon:yes stop_codon:yes gene_type:complete